MNDIVYFISSYVAVVAISFFLVNWLTNGFFIQFAKVKMSRGRKSLITIHSVTGRYFRPGEVVEGWLVFKDRQGQRRRIAVPERKYIGSSLGVKVVDVDDEKNAVLLPDFTAVSGFDAVKYENLNIRCLTAPRLDDKKILIIIILLVILLLLAAATCFMVVKLGGKIDALSTISQQAVTAATI